MNFSFQAETYRDIKDLVVFMFPSPVKAAGWAIKAHVVYGWTFWQYSVLLESANTQCSCVQYIHEHIIVFAVCLCNDPRSHTES